MDRETKLALAKILGETYRLQKRVNPEMVQVADQTIFGLLNGFEGVIESELSVTQIITNDDLIAVADILDPYHRDREKPFNGYYDIEYQLEEQGIDRLKAINVLTYFKANGQYEDVINRMDTAGSPGECRRFDLRERDV